MQTACLLGNGVSMAYSPALGVEVLTADLLELFENAGASAPEQALGDFAGSVRGMRSGHFEALLGPISSTSEALRFLPGLVAISGSGPADVTASIRIVEEFLNEIYRTGMAITLNHIAERSIGGDFDSGAWPVAKSLISLGQARDLTVGTLNYDGLLHAGMMDAGRGASGEARFLIADLADRRFEEEFEVVPGSKLIGHSLRDLDDIPSDRSSLLQMHGSLGWLRNPANPQEVWRFELGKLREADYWEAWRRRRTEWAPVVVLTDQKEKATASWPFSLGYDTFRAGLIGADRWLIAGYGLGDVPVNLLFKAAAIERARQGRATTPPTLIIGRGRADDLLERSVAELGLRKASVAATGLGVPEAFESPEWSKWAASASA